ncbi:sulfite exporter TauE/SafE family protein [Candidatus Eisenbacteria bacterium]|uniref:Sulfite exporter TauE/SafE family protein n=1 Tax=Eiseniibacteriota bacterium TaxID=2212470 RepID=A0ABV6YLQ5_UNCEI
MTERESKEGQHPEPVPSQLVSGLRWYMLGFALLGGAVGAFAGLSHSPVIATLLPLLFGLVGGAGGLYLARAQFNEPHTALRLRTLGRGISLFVVFAVVGSVYGISIRTGGSIGSFLPSSLLASKKPGPSLIDGISTLDETIELMMLRARIRALGAAPSEEAAVLQEAANRISDSHHAERLPEVLLHLAEVAAEARDQLHKAIHEYEEPSLVPSTVRNLELHLGAYEMDFREWADQSAGTATVPARSWAQCVNRLKEEAYEALVHYDGSELWMAGCDEARTALWRLIFALEREEMLTGLPSWDEEVALAEEMDRLIAAMSGSSGDTPSTGFTMPGPGFEP